MKDNPWMPKVLREGKDSFWQGAHETHENLLIYSRVRNVDPLPGVLVKLGGDGKFPRE